MELRLQANPKKRGKDGKIHYYNLITGKTRLYLKGGGEGDEQPEKAREVEGEMLDLRCIIGYSFLSFTKIL